MFKRPIVALILAVLCGCSGGPGTVQDEVSWAIAIHGGAGVISRDLPASQREAREAGLQRALVSGKSILEQGGSSLDAVEEVIRRLEDDPWFNAGRGAVFNHDGGHELDASIMNGETMACGAVAGVTTVRNPISLARMVMERTKHVLLSGPGAERFAEQQGVDRVEPQYFFTEYRYEKYQEALQDAEEGPGRDTVGAAALDQLVDLEQPAPRLVRPARLAARHHDLAAEPLPETLHQPFHFLAQLVEEETRVGRACGDPRVGAELL